jgi:hypothetical protein
MCIPRLMNPSQTCFATREGRAQGAGADRGELPAVAAGCACGSSRDLPLRWRADFFLFLLSGAATAGRSRNAAGGGAQREGAGQLPQPVRVCEAFDVEYNVFMKCLLLLRTRRCNALVLKTLRAGYASTHGSARARSARR